MTALVRILSYVRISGISKMATYNLKFLRNNVYLSLYTSAVIMHDHKNIGISVGILLISCVQPELHVISYALPVTSRAIFDFLLTPTYGMAKISPVVLPDLENICIAVEFRCCHIYKLCYMLFRYASAV